MNIWLAGLAAVLVQPLIVLLRLLPDFVGSSGSLRGFGSVLLVIIVVAASVVLIFGIPVFLILRRIKRVGWVSLGVSGALLGGMLAAFSWPRTIDGYSAGHTLHGKFVATYVDGVPTTYAWLTYGESVLWFAMHGLIGALVFWAVWRVRERPK
ncbi:hypothetical protein C7S18_06270 [Ahniella affigens]|uniref:Uncharacterized protein n=1 Tax=Ahniella affigens TaxID=2021234 RepID=A0A2P1PPQ4_9GAMM|nr:hypothetical protein [Ahniella affigens]AVP96830.1 hypothetical protein C7S18_06270 [Ahniella affigens]